MRGRLEAGLSRSGARLPATAVVGTLLPPDEEPARLELLAGSGDLLMELPPGETLRCWSVGFVIACSAPLRLEVMLDRLDGTSSEPVLLELPASTCLAGIIEVEPTPQHAARLRIHGTSEAVQVDLYDLFAVSNG
jgi:hypothetical protein